MGAAAPQGTSNSLQERKKGMLFATAPPNTRLGSARGIPHGTVAATSRTTVLVYAGRDQSGTAGWS